VVETVLRWLKNFPLVAQAIEALVLLLAAGVLYFVIRRFLVTTARRTAARSTTVWDDALVTHGVFARLAQIPPALLVYLGVSLIPNLNETLVLLTERVAAALLFVFAARGAAAVLSAANDIYEQNPANRSRPIKGYLQVVKIALYLLAALLAVATLTDQSPLLFLSGIGAMTAVLLLVFRDTILSLVASIQLSGNDMVQLGDWIEMPAYGADGDVIDVALHTVKVQNWDKTITTIPTHALIAEAFKNWRGMSESGGRRIKRSLLLDVSTVRFLEPEEVSRLSQWALLREYIATKHDELQTWNESDGRDRAINADIRRLTNLGTLRAYIEAYLKVHPRIHQGMTLLVRQLQATERGVAIEIYCFTSTTEWNAYEGIQADIFDHLYALLPDLGLRVFQPPTGADLAALSETLPR
jgi:miniconductance mechanosensitive channel